MAKESDAPSAPAADTSPALGLLSTPMLDPTAEDLERVAQAKWIVVLHGDGSGEVWSIGTDWLRRGLGLCPVAMVNNVVKGGAMSLLWVDDVEAVLLADGRFPSANSSFCEFTPPLFFDQHEQRVRVTHRVFGSA